MARPSHTQSELARSRKIFKGGNANIIYCCRKRSEDPVQSMPLSGRLYFVTLKTLAIGMLAASIFSIPVLSICLSGDRISPAESDLLSLSLASLANLGRQDGRFGPTFNETQCRAAGGTDLDCDPNVLQLQSGQTIPLTTASVLVSLLDVLYTLALLLVVLALKVKIEKASRASGFWRPQPRDYTVLVRNLPPGVTEQ